MNHKPRTRLAAMLLACLLLCPSPGRSEAAAGLVMGELEVVRDAAGADDLAARAGASGGLRP